MQFNLSALRTWLHNNNRSLATLHRAKWPDARCFDSAMNTVLSALEQAGSVKKASVTATIQILQSASLTLEDELVSDCFFNIVNCMVRECKEARPLGHMHPTVMLKPEKNFTDLSDTAAYRELRDVPLLQLKQLPLSNLILLHHILEYFEQLIQVQIL